MYRSFEQLKVLRACGIERFSETAKTPRCPFCLTLYTSDSEVRPEIDCAACRGKGEYAKELEILVVRELEAARRSQNAERISIIAEMFPDSYFSTQAKILLFEMTNPVASKQ